jgi:hypothetical protein
VPKVPLPSAESAPERVPTLEPLGSELVIVAGANRIQIPRKFPILGLKNPICGQGFAIFGLKNPIFGQGKFRPRKSYFPDNPWPELHGACCTASRNSAGMSARGFGEGGCSMNYTDERA